MKIKLAAGVRSVATRLPAKLRSRNLLLLALLALAIVGGLESYRAVGFAREIDQAQALMRSGQDLLESKRLDATEEELRVARVDFEAAERYFARALGIDNDRPLVHSLRGFNFFALGDPESARKEFTQALSSRPTLASARVGEAWWYYTSGDSAESKVRFARIVDEESPIEWLQSLDEPRLVFALLEPFLFYPDYGFELPDPDSEALGIVRPEDAIVRCVLTLHDGVDETTANMVAPLVMNQGTGRGRQVTLQDANLPLRFSVFESLRLPATA